MTTRGSLKKPDTGGHSHLEPLPDPPREPDMQQRRRTAAFDAILMAHFAHRNDVLISGDGYLRHDPANEDEQFAPDCVVAFGVDPDAIVSRNGYVNQRGGQTSRLRAGGRLPEHGTPGPHGKANRLRRIRGPGILEVRPHQRTLSRHGFGGRRADRRRIHAGSDHPRARRLDMGTQLRVGLRPVLGPRGTATPQPENGSVSADTGRAASRERRRARSQGSGRGPSGRVGIRAASATRPITTELDRSIRPPSPGFSPETKRR